MLYNYVYNIRVTYAYIVMTYSCITCYRTRYIRIQITRRYNMLYSVICNMFYNMLYNYVYNRCIYYVVFFYATGRRDNKLENK